MQIVVELLSLLLLLLMNIAHILLFLSRLFDLFKLILLIPLELCDLLHQLLLLSEYLIPLYLYPIEVGQLRQPRDHQVHRCLLVEAQVQREKLGKRLQARDQVGQGHRSEGILVQVQLPKSLERRNSCKFFRRR